MKKFILSAALLLVAGTASAATVTITGGNWDNQRTWGNNTNGDASTDVWDNGEAQDAGAGPGIPPTVLVPKPWYFGGTGDVWDPQAAGNEMDGTYGGTLEVDGAGAVTGGQLIVSGSIGSQVKVQQAVLNSWWAYEYVNLVIDFDTGLASSASYQCYETYNGPATCGAGADAFPVATLSPTGGNESGAGAARIGATFIGGVLSVFTEGYDGMGGTDFENNFSLTTAAIPVPAAVWLFGSALGLLGWARRRA